MAATAKHLVFDWNCTLLDDVHALYACTNRLLGMEGHAPLTIEKFRDNYAVPFDAFYRKMGFTPEQVEKMMKLENGMFHAHYEPLADTADLRPGAADILGHAQKHNIHAVILSNHVVAPIQKQLRRHNIEHLLRDVIAYADQATQFKHMTKGEKLRRYRSQQNIEGDTLIVGDTVEEIHIAKDQGFVSVAITGGCCSEQSLRNEGPDYVIHNLLELKTVMRERGFAA